MKKVNWNFLLVLVLLFLVACLQTDQKIATLILNLKPTDLSGVSANSALQLPSKTYMCFLEPYVSQVEVRSDIHKDINKFLKTNKFRGSEYEWGVVYGSVSSWTIESIRVGVIGDEYLTDSNGTRVNASCAFADQIFLFKPVNGKVIFNFKEKK